MMASKNMQRAAIAGLALACWGGLACDSSPPPKAVKPAALGAAKGPGAAPAAVAVATAKPVEDVRKKTLKDEDFIESPTNRDPFHSFLSELSQGKVRGPSDYFVFFDKYACEELRLIAVVSGGLDPRALFRDPAGLGIPLKVGDHLCKARWRIKRIVAEGVVVELEQDTGGAKPKLVERMLPINPGEEASK